MNPAVSSWLDQLAPDRLPPASSWWPLAPGWWILGTMLILALGTGLRYVLHPIRRLQRVALTELTGIRQHHQDDPRHLARNLEHLLRRYAVARYGRDLVAPLHNESWILFLRQHGLDEADIDAARKLLVRAYGGAGSEPIEHWLSLAEKFLRFRP